MLLKIDIASVWDNKSMDVFTEYHPGYAQVFVSDEQANQYYKKLEKHKLRVRAAKGKFLEEHGNRVWELASYVLCGGCTPELMASVAGEAGEQMDVKYAQNQLDTLKEFGVVECDKNGTYILKEEHKLKAFKTMTELAANRNS